MSGLILVGSGWHPFLFRAEINALVGTVDILHPRVVNFQDIPPPSSQEYTNLLSRLSRAALLDDVVQCGGWSRGGEGQCGDEGGVLWWCVVCDG